MDLKLKAKRGLAFLAYSLRLPKIPVGPLYVTLETGNKCNLRCPMCPQSTRPQGFPEGNMPLKKFEELLRRVNRFSPIACLTLHLSGEPLLHPDLPRMLELSEQILHRRAGFASNGLGLTAALAERILDSGLGWITFDFCADAKVFEHNRYPAKWDRTYRNITGFLEAIEKRKTQVTVMIKNVDWRQDHGESLEALKSLFRGLPVSRFEQYSLHNWCAGFAKDAVSRLNHEFPAEGKYSPCSHLWFSLVIAYDGRVHLCCRDTEGDHIVGDTAHEELDEIWNGRELQRLRRLHAQGRSKDIAACAPCDRIWTGGYSGGTPLQMLQRNLSRIFD